MIFPVARSPYGRVTGAGSEFIPKQNCRALLVLPGLPVWFRY